MRYCVSVPKDLDILQLKEDKRRTNLMVGGAGFCVFLGGTILGMRFRKNRKKTRLLVNQVNELTELQIQRIEEEKERERKRIAQELHDELSGTIAAGINYLRMKANDEQEVDSRRRLIEISDMLERGYNKARGKSHELYLEESTDRFWKRLSDNIELFSLGTDMKVSMKYDILDPILTPELKTTILLIIKEAITNVIKHAKASEVNILIYQDIDGLILEIADNGKGILGTHIKKSVGLRSIQDRASMFDGNMRILPSQPSGTTLVVTLGIGTN